MGTDRQNAANKLNAQLSTGPRSDEGRDVAKRNSLKHGLAGHGIVLPEYLGFWVGERAGHLNSSLKPRDSFELALSEHVARDLVLIEDCVRRQQVRCCSLAWRAQEHWDEDRRVAVEVLAGGLARNPTTVAAQLRDTKHGCELMIAHWKMLAAGLDKNGGWDAGQKAYALDLLGVPDGLRGGPSALDPADGADLATHLQAVVAAQLDRLERLAAGKLAEYDAQARYEAQVGIHEDDPTLKKLRRYEADCSRRLARTRGLFHKSRIVQSFEKVAPRYAEKSPDERMEDSQRRARDAADADLPPLTDDQRRARARVVEGSIPYFDPVHFPIPACIPEPSGDGLELETRVEPPDAPRTEVEAEAEAAGRPPDDLRATG